MERPQGGFGLRATGNKNTKKLQFDLNKLKDQSSSRKAKVESRRKEFLARLHTLLEAPGEHGGDIADEVVGWEKKDYELLHEALVDARVVKLASERVTQNFWPRRAEGSREGRCPEEGQLDLTTSGGAWPSCRPGSASR